MGRNTYQATKWKTRFLRGQLGPRPESARERFLWTVSTEVCDFADAMRADMKARIAERDAEIVTLKQKLRRMTSGRNKWQKRAEARDGVLAELRLSAEDARHCMLNSENVSEYGPYLEGIEEALALVERMHSDAVTNGSREPLRNNAKTATSENGPCEE